MHKIAPSYDIKWAQVDKPKPLTDPIIESLIEEILDGKLDRDVSNNVFDEFKDLVESSIKSSSLNTITGFEKFSRKDVCLGCTQFIDSLYMKGAVQVLQGDYRYHERLNPNISYRSLGNLIPDIPLIIATPFPSTGDVHKFMSEILDECLIKNIPVHIDGAWVTCSKDITFDLQHPAITSITISLSKGLGLGWNRIGVRWTTNTAPDAISIMNDFNMNLKLPVKVGIHFLRNISVDHLWNNYAKFNSKICKDFNLTPTKSIHLALLDGQPIGISPLIRFLINNEKSE
jgi:hypothetical protein